MSKKLLITLRPVDYFFFGGENTFDTDTNPEVRNYLVRSRKLPQQTGVLGLLRHILYKNKYAIGAESFNADYSKTQRAHNELLQQQTPTIKAEDLPSLQQDFDSIVNLSPIFLQYRKEEKRRFLLPAEKLWLTNGEAVTVKFDDSPGKGYNGHGWTNQAKLEYFDREVEETKTYTEKQHFGDFWVALDNGEKIPSEFEKEEKKDKGIFSSNLHIGIDKMSRMKKQQANDEAFYKQEFIRLAPGYSFAVIATVKQTVPLNIFNCSMSFGGENRTFIIQAEDWTSDLQKKWTPATAYGNYPDRMILASDTYVEDLQQLFKLCRLVIADHQPFRNIQVKTANYSSNPSLFTNLHRKKRKHLLHLLKRGSVLFPIPGQEQAVITLLKADENFHNIGYNHFYPHLSI